MPRLREQLMRFGASFLGSGFSSPGALRVGHSGNGFQQFIPPLRQFSWLVRVERGARQPLAQHVERALETDPPELTPVCDGAMQNEQPYGVVGTGMHEDFLLDHGGGFAAQHIHLHRRFDVAKKQLDAPAAVIQLGDLLDAILFGIDQRGGDPDTLGAKALALDGHFDDAHFQLLWQRLPLRGIPRAFAWAMFGLAPCLQALIAAQRAALAQILGARLMQAKDGVNAACLELGHQRPGAKTGVTEEHIALFEQMAHLVPEAQIMAAPLAQRVAQLGPRREAEDAQHGGHREAATRLLSRWLRPALLVFDRVRH